MSGIDREQWLQLTDVQRTEYAHDVARTLANGASFVGLKNDSTVACYQYDGTDFVLVPGGKFSIGFDPTDWEPTDEELASWEDTAEEYQLDPSPIVHLRRVMNQVRSIRIPTLLVEANTSEFGWRRIPSSDPRVEKILKEHGAANSITSHHGDEVIRLQRQENGVVIADEQVGGNHKDVAGWLKSGGFRLPTSDEWEYLCGTGKTTLFR